MMFKEYVQHDIGNTFVNPTEFASEVIINGASVNVVEDKDQLLYRIKKDYGGLVVGDVLFYISLEEYKKIPRVSTQPTVNDGIVYNGRACTITDVNPQDGIYEIMLTKVGGY